MEHEKRELIELNTVLAQLISRLKPQAEESSEAEVVMLKWERDSVINQLTGAQSRFAEAQAELAELNTLVVSPNILTNRIYLFCS